MSLTIYYTSEFKRNARKLLKKYPHLPQDIEGFIEQLQAGELLGDLIQHVGYSVYKARIKNSDNHKGKSAGYRIIYYVKQQYVIVLITLYSKSEQGDINAAEICAIIEEWHHR